MPDMGFDWPSGDRGHWSDAETGGSSNSSTAHDAPTEKPIRPLNLRNHEDVEWLARIRGVVSYARAQGWPPEQAAEYFLQSLTTLDGYGSSADMAACVEFFASMLHSISGSQKDNQTTDSSKITQHITSARQLAAVDKAKETLTHNLKRLMSDNLNTNYSMEQIAPRIKLAVSLLKRDPNNQRPFIGDQETKLAYDAITKVIDEAIGTGVTTSDTTSILQKTVKDSPFYREQEKLIRKFEPQVGAAVQGPAG